MIAFDGKKDPDRRRAVENGAAVVQLLGADGELIAERQTLKEYRKTSTIYAVRLDREFEVDTIEGTHTAKAGDWLAVGQAGELYPIDGAVFAATYEPVDDQ